jgi:hypothetical protein
MNPLVRDILALLDAHPLVSSIKIVHLDETPSGRLEIKIRCRIANQLQFQVWIHQGASTLDYAYQLFTSVPLLRWDNAPHYPVIATAPHHCHDEHNTVGSSPLLGRPGTDLPVVLSAVSQWVEQHSRSD